MSRRLPTSVFSRSASSSIVSQQLLGGIRRPSGPRRQQLRGRGTRIEASGVLRSWLTAASKAVRSSFAFASADRGGGLGLQPTSLERAGGRAGWRSRAEHSWSWAPRTSSSRQTARSRSARRSQRLLSGVRIRGCPGADRAGDGFDPPAVALRNEHSDAVGAGSSRRAPRPGSAAGPDPAGRCPPSTPTRSAAAHAPMASSRRRAARSTSVLMTPATTRKVTSASKSWELEIVNVWMGGAKYQFSNRNPPIDATVPGRRRR